MSGWVRKAVQAMAAWLVALVGVSLVWPPALALPHLWMLVAVGVAANALQPSYRLLEGSRTKEDRGTAVQILYSVYLVQVAALAELCARKPALALDALSLTAFGLMLAGLFLRTWSVLALGEFFTWNVAVQAGQQVIQTGPYRLLRHPSYAGALLVFLCACVLLRSWIAAAAAAVVLPAAFVRRIAREETLMKRSLPGYAEYSKKTWRLLPFVY